MSDTRKVAVKGNRIYQGDGGVDEYIFTVNKTYNGLDLSQFESYLKITFADESTDKIVLEKIDKGETLELVWKVTRSSTVVAGDAEGQVCFENEDATVVFNSEIFVIGIKESLLVTKTNPYELSSTEQLYEKLQILINNKPNEWEHIGDDMTVIKGFSIERVFEKKYKSVIVEVTFPFDVNRAQATLNPHVFARGADNYVSTARSPEGWFEMSSQYTGFRYRIDVIGNKIYADRTALLGGQNLDCEYSNIARTYGVPYRQGHIGAVRITLNPSDTTIPGQVDNVVVSFYGLRYNG